MPALIICGHRSKLGGDDLSPICIVIGTIRLMEAILLVPAATLTYVEYQHRLDEECMGHRVSGHFSAICTPRMKRPIGSIQYS